MDSHIASLFDAAGGGQPGATKALFTTFYAELRRLAERELARGGGARLGATTLLHEAYLAMGGTSATAFVDRPRFLAYAARVMRGLIIDDLRNRHAQKRGGLFKVTGLDTDVPDPAAEVDELTRLGAAVDELHQVEPALAEVVDLKFFCGFSFVEIAAMRGVSERTVQRSWEKARLYLHRQLREAWAA
jgi:RNA polymerase sigma factor (TIGR02999 family)